MDKVAKERSLTQEVNLEGLAATAAQRVRDMGKGDMRETDIAIDTAIGCILDLLEGPGHETAVDMMLGYLRPYRLVQIPFTQHMKQLFHRPTLGGIGAVLYCLLNKPFFQP